MHPRLSSCLLRLACLVLAVLQGRLVLAQAAVWENRFMPEGITVRCTLPWPAGLMQGYVPVKVELSHDGLESEEIVVTAYSSRWSSAGPIFADRTLQLKPGEQVQVEMLMPNFLLWNGRTRSARVVVETNQRPLEFNHPTRGSGAGTNSYGCLLVSDQAPSAGENQALEGILGTIFPLASLGSSRSHASHSVGSYFAVGAITWDDLPGAWQAYSSLDLVVLDSNDQQNLQEHLEPILAWVRLGGELALIGESSPKDLRHLENLSDALEVRRLVPGHEDTYFLGLGKIRVHRQGFDRESALLTAVHGVDDLENPVDLAGRWVPNSGGWRFPPNGTGQQAISPIPLRGFLMLLLGFAILVGPIHLTVLKRINRPDLMLITIPALSLLATSGILAYGILYQGLDLKAVEQSLSFLDQGSKRVSNVVRRDLFHGGFSGDGLRPAAGTAVFPIEYRSNRESSFQVRRSDSGVLLEGSFLPPRSQVRHWSASDRASRTRLVVRGATKESIEVINEGLPWIEDLFYRALDGTWYQAKDLAPGSEASAVPIDFKGSDLQKRLDATFREALPILPGGYVALLETDPFVDDLGLDWSRKAGEHFLIGLVEEEEAQ